MGHFISRIKIGSKSIFGLKFGLIVEQINCLLKKGRPKVCHAPKERRRVLISLSKAVSPYVEITLLSVSRGQCETRPRVTFPACAGSKLILFGDRDTRVCVNNLPRVALDSAATGM